MIASRRVALVLPLFVGALALAAQACGSVRGDGATAEEEQAIERANGGDLGGANFVGGGAAGRAISIRVHPEVLTQHNDVGRTGANLSERALDTESVNAAGFGKLFEIPVEGQVYAQPLFVTNAIDGHDVLYVATMKNHVYAVDADDPTRVFWHRTFGDPVPTSALVSADGQYTCDKVTDIQPDVGITSTPVIDLGSRTIYFTTKTLETIYIRDLQSDGLFRAYPHQIYRIHARDIRTGDARPGDGTEIRAEVPGTSDDSVPRFGCAGTRQECNVVRFDAARQLQRPGLLLSHGMIYFGFGAHCDFGPYHGWVMAYDAATLAQVAVYNTTAGDAGWGGGVWQSGNGLAANAAGEVFFATGNGSSDLATDPDTVTNLGTAIVGLRRRVGGFDRIGFFMPYNTASLSARDVDLGSGGPLILPHTDLLVQGGKEGVFVTQQQESFGGWAPFATSKNYVQRFVAAPSPLETGGADEIFAGPAYWNGPDGPHLYVWPTRRPLLSFAFDPASETFATTATEGAVSDPRLLQYRGSSVSVSAWGRRAGSGIVWALSPTAEWGQGSRLTAFDASDVRRELWHSNMRPDRDLLGGFAKYVAPTIAAGKVFVPTTRAGVTTIVVYGLDPPEPTDGGVTDVEAGADASDGAPPPPACKPLGTTPPPGTWSYLYANYFGPGTDGHCALCHGGAGVGGFAAGDGSAKQLCDGLKTSPLFVPSVIIADPTKTFLDWFPAHATPGMPADRAPGTSGCDERAQYAITAWAAAGAPCAP